MLTVTGQVGCRAEEVARIAAARLGFHLVTESRLEAAIAEEFAPAIPDKAYRDVLTSILARLAAEQHIVVSADGVESLTSHFPGALRVLIVAPERVRVGQILLEQRCERADAARQLKERETRRQHLRRRRFGRSAAPLETFDLVLNAESLDAEQMAAMIERAVALRGFHEPALLSAEAEAQLQFQLRLRLARHGITPTGAPSLRQKMFAHPSEEIFANLLDYYRIPWEYEPRSFPIEWDSQGRVTLAFTPDFYLPEVDLYVELTTMKQSLVTKKNRKIRLLREIYPQIRIQVFYQKDMEEMVLKYSLTEEKVQL